MQNAIGTRIFEPIAFTKDYDANIILSMGILMQNTMVQMSHVSPSLSASRLIHKETPQLAEIAAGTA